MRSRAGGSTGRSRSHGRSRTSRGRTASNPITSSRRWRTAPPPRCRSSSVRSEDRACGPWPTWPPGYGSGEADRRALYVLSALRGISPRSLIALAVERGAAASTLAWIREGRAGSQNDQAFASVLDPDAIAAAAKASGARLITWASVDYPSQLRQLHDPPGAIYVIGRAPPDVTSAVAIVGARRCTASGREAAHAIGRGLALAGLTVVSGAARGIDAASHDGAPSVQGPTPAALGAGLGGA